jgi:transcriptional regulator with XRE-family HTH domain
MQSIRHLLNTLGTQEQAAELIGCAQTTVSAWLTGRALPRRLAQRAIANATGHTIEEVAAIVEQARVASVGPGRRGIPIDTPEQARQVLAERGHPVPAEAS